MEFRETSWIVRWALFESADLFEGVCEASIVEVGNSHDMWHAFDVSGVWSLCLGCLFALRCQVRASGLSRGTNSSG